MLNSLIQVKLTLENRISDLKEFIDLLNKLGIKTHNTRIERYHKFLLVLCSTDINKVDPKSIFKNVKDTRFGHEIDWYLYILREVDELNFIFKGLKCHVPKGVNEKLCEIVGGTDFAALDKNSLSRNTQFELRIASYFCQSNFIVDLTTKTDIIATKCNICFYIECKRIFSKKQLDNNLSYAKEQLLKRIPKSNFLSKVEFYGVIAADITKVSYDHNGLVFGLDDIDVKRSIQQKLKGSVDNISKNKTYFSNKPPIILNWLQIHISGMTICPRMLFSRFSSYFIELPYPVIIPKKSQKNLLHYLFSYFVALFHYKKSQKRLFFLIKTLTGEHINDSRGTPINNRNKKIVLPEGTTFELYENEVEGIFKILEDETFFEKLFQDDIQDEKIILFIQKEIGEIKIDKNVYTFLILDFILVLYQIKKSSGINILKELSSKNNTKIITELFCRMLINKYPDFGS